MTRLRPIGFLVVIVLAFTFGQTLYQPQSDEESGPTAVSSMAELVRALGVPTLALLCVALLASLAATDVRSVRAGGAFLLGKEHPESLLPAHRSLAASARAMVAGGLVFGLLSASAAFFLLSDAGMAGQEVGPRGLAVLIQFCLAMPLAALAIGRIVFGGAADAAAVKAGSGERRTFRRQDDLMLLLYLVPPALVLAVLTWPARTLN